MSVDTVTGPQAKALDYLSKYPSTPEDLADALWPDSNWAGSRARALSLVQPLIDQNLVKHAKRKDVLSTTRKGKHRV